MWWNYIHNGIMIWKHFPCYWSVVRGIHQSLHWSLVDSLQKEPVTQNSDVLIFMMTSSNGNIFRVTGPLCGEFTGPGEFPTQRPVTRSFDVLFDLRLNKRLSKQPWGWWFKTPSWSFWRQRNELEQAWISEVTYKLSSGVAGDLRSHDGHVVLLSV